MDHTLENLVQESIVAHAKMVRQVEFAQVLIQKYNQGTLKDCINFMYTKVESLNHEIQVMMDLGDQLRSLGTRTNSFRSQEHTDALDVYYAKHLEELDTLKAKYKELNSDYSKIREFCDHNDGVDWSTCQICGKSLR